MVFYVIISWVNIQKLENLLQFNTSWLASLRTWYYFELCFSFSCSGYDFTLTKKNSILNYYSNVSGKKFTAGNGRGEGNDWRTPLYGPEILENAYSPVRNWKKNFWTNFTTHFTLFGSNFFRVWPKKDSLLHSIFLFMDLNNFHQPTPVIKTLPSHYNFELEKR